jgi:hypothetical protein
MDTNSSAGHADPVPTAASRFVEFQYMEVKDLAKQFLTLISGTLVVTVSFADKIVPLDKAGQFPKAMLAGSWLLLVLSFVLTGMGLVGIFFAAVAAREGRVYGHALDYRRLSRPSYHFINAAGLLFVAALVCLAITGGTRLFGWG